MNRNKQTYIASLLLIGVSIYLILEYPNSGKYSMIAGAVMLIGIILNYVAYSGKK